VNISGVQDLYAYQFDVNFVSSLMAATLTMEGTFLPTGGATTFISGMIDNASGTIGSTAGSLNGPVPGVSGSGTFAILAFNALATGISNIQLSDVILLDSALSDIVATTLDGTVTIDSPEPATATFFGVGLLTFLLVSRRSRFGRNDAGAQICTAGHNRRLRPITSGPN